MVRCESDREQKQMKKKKDMSREAKGKRLLRVYHEEKALTNSQAHSQEVLPNNDDSDVEIISSLLINNLNLYSKVMFQMSRKLCLPERSCMTVTSKLSLHGFLEDLEYENTMHVGPNFLHDHS